VHRCQSHKGFYGSLVDVHKSQMHKVSDYFTSVDFDWI